MSANNLRPMAMSSARRARERSVPRVLGRPTACVWLLLNFGPSLQLAAGHGQYGRPVPPACSTPIDRAGPVWTGSEQAEPGDQHRQDDDEDPARDVLDDLRAVVLGAAGAHTGRAR